MEIKLGGEARELKFGHIAIRAMEKHYGKGINKLLNEVDLDSIENLTVMTWASLKRYEKTLTIEQVDEWIEESLDSGEISYEQLANSVTTAFQESNVLPKDDGSKKKN